MDIKAIPIPRDSLDKARRMTAQPTRTHQKCADTRKLAASWAEVRS